jgi:PAS domain S-box-containing protein
LPRQFSTAAGFLNAITGIIALFVDRLVSMQKAEKSNLISFHIMEGSNDIVLITDPSGAISAFNERAVELLGYSKQYLNGMSIQSLMKDGRWESVHNELSANSVLRGHEVTLVGSGGREMDMQLNAVSLKNANEMPSELIFLFKSLKDEMNLKKVVEEKSREIEDLKENLEKKVIRVTESLRRQTGTRVCKPAQRQIHRQYES